MKKGLHPAVVRYPLTATSREIRWKQAAFEEAKLSCKGSDLIWPEEIPTSGTMSGWMRNDREAAEYDAKMRFEATKGHW